VRFSQLLISLFLTFTLLTGWIAPAQGITLADLEAGEALAREAIAVHSSKFSTFSISWLIKFTTSITGEKNRTNLSLSHHKLRSFYHKHQF